MSANGIGGKTTDKLLRRFDGEIIQVIEDRDVDRLCEHGDISKAAAEIICRNWHWQAGKAQFISFMNNVLKGVKLATRAELISIGKKAYQYYGAKTERKLKEDPYRIWSFSSFKDAEILANALQVKCDDERRLICAVEETLYKQLDTGSTRSTPEVFTKELEKLVGGELVIKALYAATKESEKEWPRLITTVPQDQALTDIEKIYARHFALPASVIMESYVKEQLLGRIKKGIPNIQATDKELQEYQIIGGYPLSLDQQLAVKTVLLNAVTCVSGGAGTGKTSVLYCVHEIITKAGREVLQVALSGKASRRLAQQTERDATTIEKLLRKVENEPDYLSQFSSPLVLIDEASMVDLHTMYRLLSILDGTPARLVFVGDWAQLPPVGSGLIYHQLMKSQIVPKVELTQNFRSVKEINLAANAIKEGKPFERCKTVNIIQCDDLEGMKKIAKREYEWNLSAESVHVIAARIRTVADINIRLHESIAATRKVVPCAPQFRATDVVVYKSNNQELGIVNGSTGVVIGGDENTINIKFDIEGIVHIPKDEIIKEKDGEYLLQHGYALTCHSAQGSEFDVVIVVVEDTPMVECSWLYTALTRAKRKVILITTENGIQNVVDRGFKAHQLNVGFHL
ncbi:exodeoxyribonuclease V alpha subunit [Paraglaciecola polaris LMG 21857]|uniref:Exodeoxyribonuclease V alpha subunit n=2 Tax=Paraglaciecola polaris TaxID=222814 RepID=K6Z830_9ALTE|nr:exodeoxyribonuclease V alpha subunit [Paraglaciecola polaris LMG 21857]